MKPLSALYYVKENKGRASILIFMMLLTTFIFLAGNYIESIYYYFDKNIEYFDHLYVVETIGGADGIEEFEDIYADLCRDEELIVQVRSPRGFAGLEYKSTLGFNMGGDSMVFDTPEDMKTAFEIFGVECDLSEIRNRSVVMSSAMALQFGLKKGDTVDSSVYSNIDGKYTLDAISEDNSYMPFYVCKDSPQPFRVNVLGKNGLSGDALREHIVGVVNGRNAQIAERAKYIIYRELDPFKYIFLAGIFILSVVLSVIIGSVITGQYIKRTYEFGVYRAIGISKKRIYGKCGAEILLMNGMAVLIGAFTVLLITFILNELKYIPEGKYLPYFSGIGVLGFLLSEVLVIVPTALLKGRSMSRADVTEF